ncbi:hypothetical protein LGZ99_20630 [Photorhabdus temperata]|uniref:hypothetical protein n=1 Tax=Photorhabdus temperata TaxID=574560 RepID=UPI0021D51910|nr:hypothetical protein [Photorhabdus temperata]MCT8349535.1 hypothetical protein [Photorhabdus temperata]
MDKKDYYYNPKEFRGSTTRYIEQRKRKRISNALILITIGWIGGIACSITTVIKKPEIAIQIINTITEWLA